MFLEARNLEKTMVHFSLRLEIEYHRLVQWGSDCGLLPAPELHGAATATTAASLLLRNPTHKDLAETFIGHIKKIFDDAAVLTKKYGIAFQRDNAASDSSLRLNPPEASLDLEQPASWGSEAGGSLVPKPPVTQDGHQSLKRKRDSVIPWVKSSFRRVRWVVKDKEGFEKLLKDLSQYNQDLYDLYTSDISRAITRGALASIIRLADIDSLGALRTLGGPDISGTTLPAIEETNFPYNSIPATASIAYSLRKKRLRKDSVGTLDSQKNEDRDLLDVSVNLEEISFDSHPGYNHPYITESEDGSSEAEDGGSLATWKRALGSLKLHRGYSSNENSSLKQTSE